VLACLLACAGTAERARRSNELRQIAMALNSYEAQNKTFPPDEQAFVGWLQKIDPPAAKLVRSGKYAILYAPVRQADLAAGADKTVVAYENVPSPGGRLVVTADAFVHTVTEPEFQAKPKLQPKK
jgi:hypothetical protein